MALTEVELTSKLVNPGDISDTRYIIRSNNGSPEGGTFNWDTTYAAIYLSAAGAGTTITNCEIVTDIYPFPDEWQSTTWTPVGATGIPRQMIGLRIQGAQNVTINGLYIRGFGDEAIDAAGTNPNPAGIDGLTITNLRMHECNHGLKIRDLRTVKVQQENVSVSDSIAWDMWDHESVADSDPRLVSQYRDGRAIGRDGFTASWVKNALFQRLVVTGETFGALKASAQSSSTWVDCRGTNHQLDGEGFVAEATFQGCIFDKGYEFSGNGPNGINQIQVSNDATLHLYDCELRSGYRFNGEPYNGHAIQVSNGATLDARGNTIYRPSGERPAGTPAVVLDLEGAGSSANADFEQVNTILPVESGDSDMGAIMDAIATAAETAIPGLRTERGLRIDPTTDEKPILFLFNPEESVDVGDNVQETVTTNISGLLYDDVTQEQMTTYLDAIRDQIRQDKTLGGVVRWAYVSERVVDEAADATERIGGMTFLTVQES